MCGPSFFISSRDCIFQKFKEKPMSWRPVVGYRFKATGNRWTTIGALAVVQAGKQRRRRCTPCFFANPLIVSPVPWPRRVSSNNSTFDLLSIPEWFHFRVVSVGQIRRSNSDARVQPDEVSEADEFRFRTGPLISMNSRIRAPSPVSRTSPHLPE
jgi:hypothetical protein